MAIPGACSWRWANSTPLASAPVEVSAGTYIREERARPYDRHGLAVPKMTFLWKVEDPVVGGFGNDAAGLLTAGSGTP